MIWDCFIFVGVVIVGNFLMIGSQFIEISSATGLYVSGIFSETDGHARHPKAGILIATAFETIIGTALSALILTWLNQFVERISFDNPFAWFIWLLGGLAAILPSTQN